MKRPKLSPALVKQKRKACGYRQVEVAEILGIAQNTYSQKENGVIPFSADELITLIYLFGCQLDDLLEY